MSLLKNGSQLCWQPRSKCSAPSAAVTRLRRDRRGRRGALSPRRLRQRLSPDPHPLTRARATTKVRMCLRRNGQRCAHHIRAKRAALDAPEPNSTQPISRRYPAVSRPVSLCRAHSVFIPVSMVHTLHPLRSLAVHVLASNLFYIDQYCDSCKELITLDLGAQCETCGLALHLACLKPARARPLRGWYGIAISSSITRHCQAEIDTNT